MNDKPLPAGSTAPPRIAAPSEQLKAQRRSYAGKATVYLPHCGERERARAAKRLAKKQQKETA